MLAELRVARSGPGRPCTTSDLLRADEAYSSRSNPATTSTPLIYRGGIVLAAILNWLR